jgi:hypothetical protein
VDDDRPPVAGFEVSDFQERHAGSVCGADHHDEVVLVKRPEGVDEGMRDLPSVKP